MSRIKYNVLVFSNPLEQAMSRLSAALQHEARRLIEGTAYSKESQKRGATKPETEIIEIV